MTTPKTAAVKATKGSGGINVVVDGKSIGTGTTNPAVAAQVLRDRGVSDADIVKAIKQVVPAETRQRIEQAEAEEAETQKATKQVQSALASGAAVGAKTLKRIGVKGEDIRRIQREQAARRKLAKIPGVQTAQGFDLVEAFIKGATLKTVAEGGFAPSEIDRAQKIAVEAKRTPAKPRPVRTDPLDLLSRPGSLPQAAALKALEPFRDRTGREIFIDDAVAAGLSNELLAVGVSERAIFDATNRLLTGPTPIRRRADTTAFGLQRPRPAADTTAFGLQRPPPQPFIGPPEPSRSRIPVAQITPLDKEGAPIPVAAGDRVPRARVRGAVDRAEARRLAILQSMAGPAGVLGLTSELDRREAIASVNASEVLGEITPEQSETLRQEINRLAAKIPGETIKEVGRSLIPIEGTRHTWAASPGWARGLNVAADIAFFIPIVGQMSALTRAGVRAPSIASQVAIAELTGPFQAVRHPIRTVQFALEPIETAIRPGKVPINAVEVRTATIRIPVAEGARSSPFDIRVPESTLVSSGEVRRGGVTLSNISDPALRTEIATTLEARDILTRSSVEGQRAVATVPGGQFELLSPALQKQVGAVAVHNSPDIRPFLLGSMAQGQEGGLFVAPSVMSRFVRSSATGRLADLPSEVQEAIAIGKIADKPVPGSLLIRDPDVIASLRGSNKLWEGHAEMELVIPNGFEIPPPSQLLFTRMVDGSRATLAVIGEPLTRTEIARLKIVGSVDTVKNIFSKPGVFRPGSSATPPTNRAIAHGQQAEKAVIRANELTRNGQIIDAAAEHQRASTEARLAIDEMRRASNRSITRLAGRTKIAALYTGNQDIRRALQEVDAAGKRTLAQGRNDTARATTRPQATTVRISRATTTPRSQAERIIAEAISRRGAAPLRSLPSRVVASAAPVRLPARAPLSTAELLRIIGEPQAQPGRPRPPAAPRRTRPPAAPTRPPNSRVTPTNRTRPPTTTRVPARETPPTRRTTPPPTDRVAPPPPDRVLPPPVEPPGRGRGRTDDPPTPPRGRFMLPNGVQLPSGVFPEIVEWPQGEVKVRGNLITGTVTFEDREPDGTTPSKGFKVIQLGRTPPPPRLLELGFEDVSISPDGIFFVGQPKRGRRSESRQLVRRTAFRR